MKKIILLIMLSVTLLLTCSCSVTNTTKTSDSLMDIQNIVRETQSAFESNHYQETQKGISKLIDLSNNSLYSENERLIAQFCATYINSGVMLDYIIKNDKSWLEKHSVDEFDVFYGAIFVEVINGEITHTDTLKSYMKGLIGATQEIYFHYIELKK